MIDNLKVEILNSTFPAKDGDPETIQSNYDILSDFGYWPTEKRYDVVINNTYHEEFLEKLRSSFDALNSEIKYNFQLDQINESISDYLENIRKESTKWFESITEFEINQDSQIKWIYISKNNDQSFLKSKELNDYMIEDISYIFRFIKNRSLEILNSLETLENPSNEDKGFNISEDMISTIPSPLGIPGVLDIYQTALLFHYLKKYRGINNISDNSLGKLVHLLTGHSDHNIKTIKGFGAIADILADRKKNQNFDNIPNYNLFTLKDFLQKIIDDIDAQALRNHPILTKK